MVWYTLCSFAKWKYQGKEPRLADNVFPSQDTIAQRAHLSRSAVCKAIKHLQELGYIEIISGGNDGRSNRYVLKGVSQKDGGVSQKDRGVSHVHTNNNTINKTINKGAKAEKEKQDLVDPEQMRQDIERFMKRGKFYDDDK